MPKPLERPWSEGRCREEGHRLAQMAKDAMPTRVQRQVPDALRVVNGRAVFYEGRTGRVQSRVQTTTDDRPPFREHAAFRQPDCRVWVKHDWNGYLFYRVSYTDPKGNTVHKSHIPGDARSRAELRAYLEAQRRKRREREECLVSYTPRDTRKNPIRDFARDPIVSTQLEPGKEVVCTSYKQFEKEVERRNLEIYKIK